MKMDDNRQFIFSGFGVVMAQNDKFYDRTPVVQCVVTVKCSSDSGGNGAGSGADGVTLSRTRVELAMEPPQSRTGDSHCIVLRVTLP